MLHILLPILTTYVCRSPTNPLSPSANALAIEYGVPSGDASKVLASASPLVDNSSGSGSTSNACLRSGRSGLKPVALEEADAGDVDGAGVMGWRQTARDRQLMMVMMMMSTRDRLHSVAPPAW